MNSRSSAMSDAENSSYPRRIHEFNMGSEEEGFQFPFLTDDQMCNHPKQQPLQNPTEIFDLSYNDFFHGRYNVPAFDPSSEAVFAEKNCEKYKNLGETSSSAAAENSSVSIPSAETGVEEDSCRSKGDQQAKVCEGGDLKPNKDSKEKKKKVEKRERERRFAFVTKSEVDNLEDGYRWRKYGQKAVKNSSFPRSYYKCTTQKCNVKKLIERSYQDSSMVVTTYLGRHNHHCPATLRGRAAALPPPHFHLPQSYLLHTSNFSYPSSLHLENMPPSLPVPHDPLMLNMDYSSFL